MASEKQPYVLINIYESLYLDRYNKKPKINKFREKWAMQDVINSVGFDRAKELLVYYFKTSKYGHPLQFFYYNFDKIDKMQYDIEQDKIHRSILREETKRMIEEDK